MADPEQIYQEVLQEEQSKGSASAVAEGRAKAARARAEEGSPHPKEPKWWPGSQPRWEGDGAGAPAAEPVEEAAPEPAEAEAPAPEPAPEPAVAEAPAPEPAAAPEPTPVEAPAPAAAAAAAPAAQATATQLAPEQRPAGVIHGTTTGTRLRPEDEVTTEGQFNAEEAMRHRRKLIDELVSSGVPQVTAEQAGGQRSPWLALLYLIIPLIAIALLVSNEDESGGGEEPPAADGGGLTVTAQGVQFDTDEITLPAEGGTINFVNDDSVQHNIAIYPDQAAADSQSDALFDGEIISGGDEVTYEVGSIDPGEYIFQCDIHPAMNGTAIVEEGGGETEEGAEEGGGESP